VESQKLTMFGLVRAAEASKIAPIAAASFLWSLPLQILFNFFIMLCWNLVVGVFGVGLLLTF